MKKVPRNACMNQKEFNDFIFNLNNFGFDLDVEGISSQYDDILGKFSDETEEILSDLLFYDEIYSKVIDYSKGHIKENVYYKGDLITMENLQKYKKILEDIVETKYAEIDKNLLSLKIAIGIVNKK